MTDEYENNREYHSKKSKGGGVDMSFIPVTNAVRTKEIFSKEIIKEDNTRYKRRGKKE